jgi:hypothetical protein
MQIPKFPELEIRLFRVLGPTSEAVMLHQLVYWFGKPKMQNRWSAYKTYEEWKNERGLNRKQVDKGRKRLKAYKLVEEKHGNYKKVYYRVDWVRFAELLSIPLKGSQSDDLDDFDDDIFFDEPLQPLKGVQSSWSDTPKGGTVENDIPLVEDEPDTYDENSSSGGVQSNARDYAVNSVHDNSPLQGAPEPAFAEPGAPEINRDKKQKEGDLSSLPSPDKRHSQATEPPKPMISKERQGKAYGLIFGLSGETDASRFADRHIAGKVDANDEPFTTERVAEKVRELLQGDEPLEAYIPWVERCLDDKRADSSEIGAAS